MSFIACVPCVAVASCCQPVARKDSADMPDGRLILGTRRYSSWSLRGWLAVRLAGLDVEEVVVPLAGGGLATPELKAISPSGLAPYLVHNGLRVWETLAICEYCAEISGNIWPAE